jgi:hypothetical protein
MCRPAMCLTRRWERDKAVKLYYFIGVVVVLLTVASFFGVGQWP